jgi:hypothetical protein
MMCPSEEGIVDIFLRVLLPNRKRNGKLSVGTK